MANVQGRNDDQEWPVPMLQPRILHAKFGDSSREVRCVAAFVLLRRDRQGRESKDDRNATDPIFHEFRIGVGTLLPASPSFARFPGYDPYAVDDAE